MPRNIARINNYYNNIESQNDWQAQGDRACKLGAGNLIAKFAPKETYGWARRDKCMVALREALDLLEKLDAADYSLANPANGRDAEGGAAL